MLISIQGEELILFNWIIFTTPKRSILIFVTVVEYFSIKDSDTEVMRLSGDDFCHPLVSSEILTNNAIEIWNSFSFSVWQTITKNHLSSAIIMFLLLKHLIQCNLLTKALFQMVGSSNLQIRKRRSKGAPAWTSFCLSFDNF